MHKYSKLAYAPFCAKSLVMDGWKDGWMDGWMNGSLDGWMDGSKSWFKDFLQQLKRSLSILFFLPILFRTRQCFNFQF